MKYLDRKSADGVDQFVQSGWDIMTKTDDVGKMTYYTGMSAVSGAGSSSGSFVSGSSSGSSAVESGDSVKYFHYNHRGDTVLVTDSEGNVLNNFSYEAYGKPTNSEGFPVNNLSVKNIPNLFIGSSGIRYDTKTNLHYMRFRWFSAAQMRFISPDLLMDLNRYAYVSGEPIRHTDITGLKKDKYVVNDVVCNDVLEWAGEYFFGAFSGNGWAIAIIAPERTQFVKDVSEFAGYGLSETVKWLDKKARLPIEKSLANGYKDFLTFGPYGIPNGEPGAGKTFGLIEHTEECHGSPLGYAVAGLSLIGVAAASIAAGLWMTDNDFMLTGEATDKQIENDITKYNIEPSISRVKWSKVSGSWTPGDAGSIWRINRYGHINTIDSAGKVKSFKGSHKIPHIHGVNIPHFRKVDGKTQLALTQGRSSIIPLDSFKLSNLITNFNKWRNSGFNCIWKNYK